MTRRGAPRAHRRADVRGVARERHEQEVNTDGSSSQPVWSGVLAGNGGARAGRGAGISVSWQQCWRRREVLGRNLRRGGPDGVHGSSDAVRRAGEPRQSRRRRGPADGRSRDAEHHVYQSGDAGLEQPVSRVVRPIHALRPQSAGAMPGDARVLLPQVTGVRDRRFPLAPEAVRRAMLRLSSLRLPASAACTWSRLPSFVRPTTSWTKRSLAMAAGESTKG